MTKAKTKAAAAKKPAAKKPARSAPPKPRAAKAAKAAPRVKPQPAQRRSKRKWRRPPTLPKRSGQRPPAGSRTP